MCSLVTAGDRRRLVTGVAVLALALGACGDDGPDAGGTTAPSTVTPDPQRRSPPPRRCRRSTSPTAWRCSSSSPATCTCSDDWRWASTTTPAPRSWSSSRSALRASLFTPVALDEPDTRVEAGRRRDLQIGLGTAVCPAAAGPAQVEVVAEIGGVRQHGLIDVPIEPLQRISDASAGASSCWRTSTSAFSDEFAVDDGGVLTTAVTLARRAGDEPIEVTNVRGSVLLELVPAKAATPLAAMAPGERCARGPGAVARHPLRSARRDREQEDVPARCLDRASAIGRRSTS